MGSTEAGHHSWRFCRERNERRHLKRKACAGRREGGSADGHAEVDSRRGAVCRLACLELSSRNQNGDTVMQGVPWHSGLLYIGRR